MVDCWMPTMCHARGCRIATQYNIDRLQWEICHWHPDETTIAGVYLDSLDAVSDEMLDELARVAHLAEPPAEPTAYGVRWYRQKTLDEIMGTADAD